MITAWLITSCEVSLLGLNLASRKLDLAKNHRTLRAVVHGDCYVIMSLFT